MANPCSSCAHPAKDVIDAFCRNGRYVFETGEDVRTAKDLLEVLKDKYPFDKLPTESNVSVHKKKHVMPGGIKYIIDSQGSLKTPDGKVIPHISPIESMRIMVTLGTMQIMEHPEKISPGHITDAVGNLARIGGAIKEEDEVKKAWAEKLKAMAKAKVKKTEGNVTEVDFEAVNS
jgi:hypothetical protein